jgi:hypothetical protein
MKPARFSSTSTTARVPTFLTRCASFFRFCVYRSGLGAASSAEVDLPVAKSSKCPVPNGLKCHPKKGILSPDSECLFSKLEAFVSSEDVKWCAREDSNF